jgi:hypothetical protein
MLYYLELLLELWACLWVIVIVTAAVGFVMLR